MALEFMPWYGTAEQMVRCGGDDGCGALLMDGDTSLHQKWHDMVWPHIEISAGTIAIGAARVPDDVRFLARDDPE